MKKEFDIKRLSFILALSFLLTNAAFAVNNQDVALEKGNVPATFSPGATLTFDADGDYKVSYPAYRASTSENSGVEIGDNLEDENPEAYEAANKARADKLSELPVYTYEEYYIAGEGAVATYDQNGELIRVRGNYTYHSTLDQYLVNGVLPDGKYVGTYGEFAQWTSSNENKNSTATARQTQTGRITTFGDYWPKIDKTEWPDCNTDPVPNYGGKGPNYGDRIGTRNNKLYVGDVALKSRTQVPYDSNIKVTIQASDTDGHGRITKTMRVRDTMSSSANSILDIFRWDDPEWFTGKPQRPNDLYFGQKYDTQLSFPNTDNSWTYNE